MAKLPGWIKQSGYYVEDGEAYVLLRIRWWHPGLWLALARAAWRRR